ncbi:MAG: hypothetical protein ACTSVY_07775 [Candidatus Helarchaeota archaeon]
MSAVISGIYGVVLTVFGFLIILLRVPSYFLVFVSAIMFLIMMLLGFYLYNKIKPFKIKELFISKDHPINKKFASVYSKYGVLTTVSNLATFGVLAQVSLIMVYITYLIGSTYLSMMNLGASVSVFNMTQLITLIYAFVFIEVAVTFFSGPLNVEISEAHEKKDQKTIEESVNSMGKVGFVLALPIVTAMVITAPYLIKFFAFGSVSKGGILSPDLYVQ